MFPRKPKPPILFQNEFYYPKENRFLFHIFSEILLEAEELWDRQADSDTTSESGLSSTSGCSSVKPSSYHTFVEAPSESGSQRGRTILGNPHGPTVISVNGVNTAAARQQQLLQQQLDSMLFQSLEEPSDNQLASATSSGHNEPIRGPLVNAGSVSNIFDEAVDLEPIDFEHFVDEPEMNNSERMFRVAFGESPPSRGR